MGHLGEAFLKAAPGLRAQDQGGGFHMNTKASESMQEVQDKPKAESREEGDL